MNKGLLIVTSAPSGCGKTTMLSEILKDKNYYYSVSFTTRSPRENEIDGVSYNFCSKEEFQKFIDENRVLEYVEYCGNYYGTPNHIIEEMRCKGRDVILEIEVKGAMKVKELCKDAIFVFITPPSIDELERRLRKRGTESEEVIEQRLKKALEELKYMDRYDYIVINGDLNKAVNDFNDVVKAEKLKAEYNKEFIDEVIRDAETRCQSDYFKK